MLCQKNEEFRIEEETGNAGRQIEQKGVSATGNFPNSRDSIKPPLLMETARVILPKKLNPRFQAMHSHGFLLFVKWYFCDLKLYLPNAL